MSNAGVEDRLSAVETFVRSMAADVNQASSRLWHVFEKQAGHSVELADLKAVQAVHSRDLSEIAGKLDVQTKDISEVKAVQEIHVRDISDIKTDVAEVKAVQAVHTKELSDIKVTQEDHSGKLEWLKADSDVRHKHVVSMLNKVLDGMNELKSR
ncbi:hypothetical protein [Nocardia aurantia]|uniref:Uncharacterized protein n=1 Tax=Nocardia aurantia TaxID=2585199 RepID=A0A7K0DXK8_9NOCA|nr:hypothetical protein [Nocardia aurantia]MQY30288.1 hypothetical protein [Nocardia aurantia]